MGGIIAKCTKPKPQADDNYKNPVDPNSQVNHAKSAFESKSSFELPSCITGIDQDRHRRLTTACGRRRGNSDFSIHTPITSVSKQPENSPCHPDLIACCRNIATFLVAKCDISSQCGGPTARSIYSYMRILFELLKIEPECCVYVVVYIKRLLSMKSKIRLHSGNWQSILVGCCLLASKYVDDCSMRNRDFSIVLNDYSIRALNKLETFYLITLDWRLHVPISEYTTQYFNLVSLPTKNDPTHKLISDIDVDLVKSHFNPIHIKDYS